MLVRLVCLNHQLRPKTRTGSCMFGMRSAGLSGCIRPLDLRATRHAYASNATRVLSFATGMALLKCGRRR